MRYFTTDHTDNVSGALFIDAEFATWIGVQESPGMGIPLPSYAETRAKGMAVFNEADLLAEPGGPEALKRWRAGDDMQIAMNRAVWAIEEGDLSDLTDRWTDAASDFVTVEAYADRDPMLEAVAKAGHLLSEAHALIEPHRERADALMVAYMERNRTDREQVIEEDPR